MSDAITVCCATAGANDALELMWRSFLKFHGLAELYLYDNGPDVDASRVRWSILTDGPIVHHGCALDRLVRLVSAPFVLVVDDDVEFLAPVVGDMIELANVSDAFCVCPPKRYDMGTATIEDGMGGFVEAAGQDRIDPCCALFRTAELKQLLKWVSFTCYRSPLQGKHYDTGSMLYHVAKAAGLRIETPEWLWSRIWHAGTITWGMAAPEGSPDRVTAEERYAEVKRRLAALRGQE